MIKKKALFQTLLGEEKEIKAEEEAEEEAQSAAMAELEGLCDGRIE